jgi:UDP-N-acetylmuramoyl-L-alanyl-D-glutamate--2,6-diaminopimelate ligase
VHVLVDYAHKPDALKKVLETLRKMGEESGWTGRLITVMGCGGDRDRTKRPVMGSIAAEFSDLVWVTSDNPRSEDPLAIIGEITSGIKGRSNWKVEPDRTRAIRAAIAGASPGDLVVIAGKGHETYQIVKDPASGDLVKIDFDDRIVASEALRARP